MPNQAAMEQIAAIRGRLGDGFTMEQWYGWDEATRRSVTDQWAGTLEGVRQEVIDLIQLWRLDPDEQIRTSLNRLSSRFLEAERAIDGARAAIADAAGAGTDAADHAVEPFVEAHPDVLAQLDALHHQFGSQGDGSAGANQGFQIDHEALETVRRVVEYLDGIAGRVGDPSQLGADEIGYLESLGTFTVHLVRPIG